MSRLKLHRLPFTVVTPLFLGGADPLREMPEIRERPIVDMWRYWFRALVGGICGTDDTARKTIRAKEQSIFGGVADEGTACPFRVSVAAETLTARVADKKHPGFDNYLRYLGYGLEGRRAIEPGSAFTLELVCADDTWAQLAPTVDVWSTIGGLGGRYRRALGAVDRTGTTDAVTARSLSEVILGAQETLRKRLFGSQPPAFDSAAEPEFPVLAPSHFRARLCPRGSESFSTYGDALTAIRTQLHVDYCQVANDGEPRPGQRLLTLGSGFGWRQRGGTRWPFSRGSRTIKSRDGRETVVRYYYAVDHDEAHRLRTTPAPLPNPAGFMNIAFGLPVTYGGWRLSADLVDSRGKSLRRPSPMVFRVIRLAPDRFKVLVMLFKSRFKPLGSGLTFKQKHLAVPDWSNLDRFLNSCDGDDVTL